MTIRCDTSDTWNAKCDIKLKCDTCDTRPHCQEECDGDLGEPQSLKPMIWLVLVGGISWPVVAALADLAQRSLETTRWLTCKGAVGI